MPGLDADREFIACELGESVNIDTSDGIPASTMVKMFHEATKKFSTRPALTYQSHGDWKSITYAEYYENCRKVALAFIKLGLEPRKSVCVLSKNCPEWFFSEFAAFSVNSVLCGVYPTSSAEACAYILNLSQCNICVVDSIIQLEKIHSVRDQIPTLKAVIQIEEPFSNILYENVDYHKWSDVMTIEASSYERELNQRSYKVKPNECALLLFTSGTTGKPKAVMLSHDNLSVATEAIDKIVKNKTVHEKIVSYLPLCFIGGQFADIFCGLNMGAEIIFADKNGLKGSVFETTKYARPTNFVGIPSIYEKLQTKLEDIEKKMYSVQRFLLQYLKKVSLDYHSNRAHPGIMTKIIYQSIAVTILGRIKKNLGLDRVHTFTQGSAPPNVNVNRFLLGYDIVPINLYGCSETTGMVLIGDNILNSDTMGKVFNHFKAEIHNPNEEGQGEIRLRSRQIFMGYLGDLESTKKCRNADGWFHTGDLGKFTDENYIIVNGRTKEIIITSSGFNVPPYHIETCIRSELPVLSNVFVIGNCRKYLTCLVALKTEIDKTGKPCNLLQPDVIKWIESLGLKYKHLSDVLEAGPCPVVLNEIHKGLKRYNANALSNPQKVHKAALLPNSFSISTGELGNSMKVKRSFVEKKYEHLIDTMYAKEKK
ncbi:ACSBG1.2 family protein [Megaselia abdita]